jgi:hypothetical protein
MRKFRWLLLAPVILFALGRILPQPCGLTLVIQEEGKYLSGCNTMPSHGEIVLNFVCGVFLLIVTSYALAKFFSLEQPVRK